MNHRERGSTTVFLAVVTVALFAVLGLVADGGAHLRAAQSATATAEEAARAATQAVDVAALLSGEQIGLDPDQAAEDARAYLRSARASGRVTTTETTVTVTVTESAPTTVLSLIGITELHSRASARARLATVPGEGP